MKPRPLTFKRRLLWSLALFWRNLLSQIGLTLLALVGTIVITLIGMVFGLADLMMLTTQLSGTDGVMTPPDPFAMMAMLFSPRLLAGLLFVLIASGLLMFWCQATLYQIAADSLITGERAKLKTALKKSFSRLPDFMTTIGLVLIIVLLAEVASGLFAAAAGDSIFGIVIAIASLAVMVWLSLTFVMAGPIALLENHDPIGTLSRTWHLVQGMRWRMLGHFLLLGLTMIVVSLIAWLPLWFGAMVGGVIAATLGFLSLVLSIIVTFGIIFVSLFFGESFYFEARAIKGHWKAGWGDVPDESWHLCEIPDDVEVPVGGRGIRAWLDFILLSIILMALIYGAALLLPPPSSMSMMSHSSQIGMPRGIMHHQINPPGTGNMQIEPTLEPTPPRSTQAPPNKVKESANSEGTLRISLTQDNFWNDGETPSLWLKVSIKGLSIPNDGIDLGNILRLDISSITNRDGNNIYNRESPMEEEFFRRVNLQSNNGMLHGIRNIQLLKGSTMEEIVTIKGELIMTLPAKIEKFNIGSSDVGRHFDAKALSLELKSMEGNNLAIDVSGLDPKRRFLGVVAISDSARQSPRSWGTSESGEILSYSYDFDNAFNRAELYVANQIVEKQNSFTLNHKTVTIEMN